MAETAERLTLVQAERIAESFVEQLKPGCERIEIAGSIRRKRPDIGDIELVAIPTRQADLFGGEADSLLDGILDSLMHRRWLVKIKGGDRYKQFKCMDQKYIRGGVGYCLCRMDLFIVTPETWGAQFAIRTGPADFSHKMVTKRAAGGLCPSHLSFREGRIWHDERALSTPEEADVFKVLEIPWVEPEQR